MEELLIRVEDGCKVTGLGRTKMYELLRNGEIKSVRIGRSVRIPVASLREWVEEQTRQPSLIRKA